MDEHAPQRDPEAPPVELIAVRAHNPGPMTLSGTNSYVLRDGDRVWVVDPGPRDPEHLAELLLRCGPDAHPQGVLVTHRHLDHTAGAATLARQLSARSGLEVPLWAADQEAVPGSRPLPATLEGAHGTVGHIVHLPGHTSDSVAVLVDGGRLLAGDTLLGGSSTVIMPHHNGSLSDYLQSLAILRAMTLDGRIGSLHPGHGEPFDTPTAVLAALEQSIAHRRERIEEVRRARRAGVLTMDRLLRAVYGTELSPELEEPARWNLRAALDHLAAEG
ncbi:MBL fold metallo-hydrolase [Brachybacterium saurashtrense]|uniref:MBL fold metallo-hydrolase n=1 Tax=Brachybacterium saurashtrense TaxID=556288 RepID=A0A345YQ45_9MICO|nr:MBL fold metallo-hydrolase [Brachybacterium saurashtrense]AXK46047.1 MBL fold metallo-hydrolase [Brachybacterium saurashtrense]RRR23786.1 MBL fold metallo-hydrolase [Brachybacterium saurashtrense]